VSTPAPHPAWVSTGFDIERLQAVLDVELHESALSAEVTSLPTAHGGVLGAQMLGQMVAACESSTPGKSVSTVTMHFLRASRWEEPLQIVAQRLSDGRRFSVLQVDFVQGDRQIARGEALLASDVQHLGPDVLENQPGPRPHGARALWPWDVDTSSPVEDEVDVWARIPAASDEARGSRALIAFATESLTVPLAIDRCGLRSVGGQVPQAVVSHSVTYVSGLDVRRWHRHRSELVSHEGMLAVGRGEVLDEAGRRAVTTQTIATVDVQNERLLADRS
jgi:acyl-CoA thioesterase-2